MLSSGLIHVYGFRLHGRGETGEGLRPEAHGEARALLRPYGSLMASPCSLC